MEIGADLERYFATSDQVPTKVAVTSTGGVLLQCLPGADPAELQRVAERLGDRLRAAQKGAGGSVAQAAKLLFGDEPFDVLASYPLSWKCTCSKSG